MKKFKLDKLVRDKIVQIHYDLGGSADYRVLENDTEYLKSLQQKLIEEASEIKTTDPEKVLAEITDLQEIIDCMIVAIGKSKEDVTKAQTKKRKASGSFKKRLFVNTVTLPDDEYWAHYYEKDPKRFPRTG
jgi:predicted house-cleaning noncanonical NTP pyrophosphatase (MazG superfamily)